MAIILQKGQRIDLTKGNPTLERLVVGLGWDPIEQKRGGVLGGLFGGGGADMDIDASVIMLRDDRFAQNSDLIYFGNLTSACGGVQHTGDNLTGDGDGDDEQVIVQLGRIPQEVNRLIFVVNIYDCVNRKQDFGQVANAYIRVVNGSSKEELLKFNLSDNYQGLTSLTVAEIYRNGSEWKFGAIGSGSTDANLSAMLQHYA